MGNQTPTMESFDPAKDSELPSNNSEQPRRTSTTASMRTSASRRHKFTNAVRSRFGHSRTTSKNSSASLEADDLRQSEPPLTSSDTSEREAAPSVSAQRDQNKDEILDGDTSPESFQSDPLEGQSRFILSLFAGTTAAALLASHLHWSLGWLVLLLGGHALWKSLIHSVADGRFLSRQKAAADQWKASNHTETVQWMNSILSSIWPLINNDVFVPFVDLLEDALQVQVPGIVHAVRVEDLDQGVVPLTVNSLKVLPPGEEHFLGHERVTQQKQAEQVSDRRDADDANAGVTAGKVDEEQQQVDLGEHVNLEISFSYRAPAHARKGPTTKSSNAEKDRSVGESNSLDEQNQQATSWLSYFSAKGGSRASAAPAETIHMLLYLAIGLQKIAAVEVPVWIEMIGIEGKMRLRVQLIPSTPFVKHVGFTLLGQPKLELSAKPLGRNMAIDAMNLPLLSSYVLKSVQTTVEPFVAPGSYTIDLGGILGAGDGPTNTYALGIICVVIHSASDLPAADTNGQADPFVSVSFARAGKPLYRTRVLVKTKNPVWQEVAYILVSPDEVRDHDRLRLTAFDADRFSADDPLGKVEISVDRLISKSLVRETRPEYCSEMELREDPLQPMSRGERGQGTLKYSITFARLVLNADAQQMASTPTRMKLMQNAASRAQQNGNGPEEHVQFHSNEIGRKDQKPATIDEKDSGKEHPANQDGVPHEWESVETPFDRFIRRLGLPVDDSVMKARYERHQRVQKLTDMLNGEQASMNLPPDPNWPAGILAFHIHSIQGLEVTRTQRSFKAANLSGGASKMQTTTEDPTNEGSGSLPSSYVQVFLNDQPTLRTRTKKYDPRPFINAGSERVVFDWRSARIDFVVRDSRQREGDAILGVVGLKVADVLAKGARKSGWYTLTGGLGFGKMQVTLLWRSAHLPIPKLLSGWNVGVVEFSKLSAQIGTQFFDRKDAHFIFYTNGGKLTTPSMTATDGGVPSQLGEETSTYSHDFTSGSNSMLRIPVRQRYPGELIITLKVSARSTGKHRTRAIAVVPLQMLQDNAQTDLKVPLYLSSDWMHVEQASLKAIVNHSDKQRPAQTNDGHSHHHHVHTKALEQVCSPELSCLPEVLSPKDGDYYTGSLQRAGYAHLSLHFFPGLADDHRSILAGDHELRYAHESWQALVDCGERERPLNAKRWARDQSKAKKQSNGQEQSQEPSQVSQGKIRERDFTRASAGEQDSSAVNAARQIASNSSIGDAAQNYVKQHERSSEHRNAADEDEPSGSILDKYDSDDGEGRYAPSIIASDAGDPPLVHEEDGLFTTQDAVEGQDDDKSSSSQSEGDDARESDTESMIEDRRARRRNLHRQERGAAQIKSVRTLSWLKQNLQDGMDRVGRNVGSANEQYGSSQRRRMLGKMEKEGVSKF